MPLGKLASGGTPNGCGDLHNMVISVLLSNNPKTYPREVGDTGIGGKLVMLKEACPESFN